MSRLVAAPLEEEGLRHRGEVAEAGSRSGSEETPGEEGQTFWGQDASFSRKDPPFQLIACLQRWWEVFPRWLIELSRGWGWVVVEFSRLGQQYEARNQLIARLSRQQASAKTMDLFSRWLIKLSWWWRWVVFVDFDERPGWRSEAGGRPRPPRTRLVNVAFRQNLRPKKGKKKLTDD